MKIHREMEFDDVRITAKGIIDKYQSKDEKPKITLLKVFKDHNERCATLAGKEDMSPATVGRYETSYRHTQEFIRDSFGKDTVQMPFFSEGSSCIIHKHKTARFNE